MTRSQLKLLLAAATAMGASACNTVGKSSGGDRAGSGSVLASVGGLSETDLKQPELGFFLICKTGVRIKGTASKDASGKDIVSFAGSQVADGDSCSMEITAKVSDPNYVWFGYENGKPVEGLLYGSDEQKVAGKLLKLQLYKLYAVKAASGADDAFALVANVDFHIDDAALTPADAKASASLACGKDQFAGAYKKTADKQATLTFDNLSVKAFADKTCERLVVVVDKKEAFSATVKDLAVKAPKKGVPMTFPAAAGTRYTLEPSVPADDIGVDATIGDLDCMRYEAATAGAKKKCTDRIEAKLPFAKSYVVAKVEGKLTTGLPVTYYMAAGETGIGLYEGASLTVAAANAVLAKDASADAKKAFHFYKDTAAAALMGATFDAAALKAAGADAVDLKDMAGVKLLNLATVSVHGFHQLADDKALNQIKDSATWIAAVSAKASKATDKDQTFLVAGYDKYFHSLKPLVVADKPVYLDTASLVADLAAPSATDRFRLYATKSMTLAAATCKLDDLTAPANAMTSDQLNPAAAPDTAAATIAELDACEVSLDAAKALSLENYTLTYSYMAWGWFDVAP